MAEYSSERDDILKAVVDSCRTTYGPDRVKIIEDQGEYQYIIRLLFNENIWAQIAISKDQSDLMDVFLGGVNVPVELKESFNRVVSANRTVDQLGDCMELAEQWWTGVAVERLVLLQKPQKRPRKKKDKIKKVAAADDDVQSSPSHGLKPAQDVVSRILWDQSLPRDGFIVGYLDRFIGIVEKPFNVFTWEGFDKVDPEAAAIPRHRIQYFKYKTAKVWDRKERLDFIFGSSGCSNNKSIEMIVKKEDQKDGTYRHVEESDSSETDDEVIESLEWDHKVDANQTGLEDVPVNRQPDYYLSIPIRSPELISRLSNIQDSLRDYYPNAIKKFVSPTGFHITVCLFCSDELGPFGIKQLANAISEQANELQILLNGAKIQFRGPALFKQYKVVVALPDSTVFDQLIGKIGSICVANGFKFYGPSRLHLTICKVRSSRDPNILQPIENMCTVSRFNCIESDVTLSLKPLGSSGDIELLCSDLTGPKIQVPPSILLKEEDMEKKLVGFHVKEAYQLGGLFHAIYKAAAVGAQSVAFFFQNKTSFDSSPESFTPENVQKFQEVCAKCQFSPENIVPHGSYIINVGSGEIEEREASKRRVIEDIGYCDALGIDKYNIHLGRVTEDYDNFVDNFLLRAAQSINEIHKETPNSKVIVVLETGAGQFLEVGRRFEEIRKVIELVENKSRIGVCIDTCHIFQAGYDIRTPIAYSRTMCTFDRIIGFHYLKAMHLNDAKVAFGQHVDRHETIGKGYIGIEAFRLMMNDHRLNNIPIILETPYSHDDHLSELQLLEKLTEQKGLSWAIDRKTADDWETVNRSGESDSTKMTRISDKIWEYYQQNIQDDISFQTKDDLRIKLETIFKRKFENCHLFLIGGSVNGLGTKISDIDMSLIVNHQNMLSWQDTVDLLRSAEQEIEDCQLINNSDVRVGVIPILRLEMHPPYDQFQVDINCNELVSVYDSHLLYHYAKLDHRFPALCLTVKRWAADQGINDALNGFLNNYTFVLLVLHFFQVGTVPAILPNLQALYPAIFSDERVPKDIQFESTFDVPVKDKNDKSVAELLIGFLAYYSRFSFATEWISIQLGAKLNRSDLPSDTYKFLIFIEDPFEKKNTARCVLKMEHLDMIRNCFKRSCQALKEDSNVGFLNH